MTGVNSVSQRSQDTPFQESTAMKVLACIPAIGLVASLVGQNAINKDVKKHEGNDRALAELTSHKNHYKIAGIIHAVLCIAAIITLIVTGVIFGKVNIIVAGMSGGVFLGIAIKQGYDFYRNYHSVILPAREDKALTRPLMIY